MTIESALRQFDESGTCLVALKAHLPIDGAQIGSNPPAGSCERQRVDGENAIELPLAGARSYGNPST